MNAATVGPALSPWAPTVAAILGPLGYRAEARFNRDPTWLFLPGPAP